MVHNSLSYGDLSVGGLPECEERTLNWLCDYLEAFFVLVCIAACVCEDLMQDVKLSGPESLVKSLPRAREDMMMVFMVVGGKS
jgi:hypothetical protein